MLWPMIKVLLVLALVLVAAVSTLKLLQAKLEPPRGKERTIRVLERLPVNQRSHLLLVSIGQKLLLLGVSAERVSLLAELDAGAGPGTAGPERGEEFKQGLAGNSEAAGWETTGPLKYRIASGLRKITAFLEGQRDYDGEDE